MNAGASLFLQAASEFDWLASIGQPLVPSGGTRALRMPEWDTAMKYYSSAWLGITYDAAVLLGDHVQQHAPDAYTAWNDTVVMYSKAVDPLVERVIQVSDAPSKYRDVLTAGIQWDLLSCCMEFHYSEVWDCCTDRYTRFFRELTKWYAKGRLPCGSESTPVWERVN